MTKERPWMKYITKDDMPNDDLLTFSDYVGIEKTVDIVLALPGLTIPIPRKPFRIAKEKYIIDNFDGTKYCICCISYAFRNNQDCQPVPP